jgi:hypothetical protein
MDSEEVLALGLRVLGEEVQFQPLKVYMALEEV